VAAWRVSQIFTYIVVVLVVYQCSVIVVLQICYDSFFFGLEYCVSILEALSKCVIIVSS
jgi:hypothetical protein